MIGVEGFTGKLGIITGAGVLIDIDHD